MVGHHGLERRAVPQLQRIDRLHVVMTVEQHVRTPAPPCAAGLGDNGRVTGGRVIAAGRVDPGVRGAPSAGRSATTRL